MSKIGKKGYIGPLGDDFPSIFPIALGLMIFFSTIYVAYSAYQSKEDYVQTMRANIMISRAVRYQIYFDEDYWDFACDLASALKTNYAVHLAMWLEEEEETWRGTTTGVVNFGYNNYALCPKYSGLSSNFWRGQSSGGQPDPYAVIADKTKNRVITIMTYPVLYTTDEGNKPVRLVVVTWR